MTIREGDIKWAVAKRSGPYPAVFPRQVKVIRLLEPLAGCPYDCDVQDIAQGHDHYFSSSNLYDSEAEAKAAIKKGAGASMVILGPAYGATMKVKLNAATRLAAASEKSFPSLFAFFKVHDENVGGSGSSRSHDEYKKDLTAFIDEHGLEAASKLDKFLKPLTPKQLEDVSDVVIGEQPRTVTVPQDIKRLLWNMFPED